MKLTDGEKVIVGLIAELHRKVGDARIADAVIAALDTGNTWGLKHVLPIENDIDDDVVQETRDILDMWQNIEETYAGLGLLAKQMLEKNVKPFKVRFEGWSITGGDKHADVATFLTKTLGEYGYFSGRDFDSHAPGSLASYRRMLSEYHQIRSEDGYNGLTAKALERLIAARTHPE